MKFCLEKSTFNSFGLPQKVNRNASQPKQSVNFNMFSHTFITFTAYARQLWTDSCDCYSEYLIIYFD